MAAGVSTKLWLVGNIVDLIEVVKAPEHDMGDTLYG